LVVIVAFHADPVRLLVLVAAALASIGGSSFPHFRAGCERADFRSDGSIVRAEFCGAPVSTGSAVVVVLHGCGGFSTFDHQLATTLPQYGIATLDVDYFALTPPTSSRGFCLGGGDPSEALPTWIRVVRDAGAMLGKRPGVRSVGVVGWSLGADLALAAATASPNEPPPFSAVAGFSADPPAPAARQELPPAILLYAAHTDWALLPQAFQFVGSRHFADAPAQIYVYPDGKHDWPGFREPSGSEKQPYSCKLTCTAPSR
jgi:dienelactone hydrolase